MKIDGERAYDIARSGEAVEIGARTVEVHSLMIVEMPDAETTVFEAECGKGTYVRALARDMGRDLGCFGHVVELRRVAVGGFEADAARVALLTERDYRHGEDCTRHMLCALDSEPEPVRLPAGYSLR